MIPQKLHDLLLACIDVASVYNHRDTTLLRKALLQQSPVLQDRWNMALLNMKNGADNTDESSIALKHFVAGNVALLRWTEYSITKKIAGRVFDSPNHAENWILLQYRSYCRDRGINALTREGEGY